MTFDAGRDFLLQVEDSPGGGTYTTIGGMRAKSITINNEEIDVSSGDAQWKQRLVGGGLKELSVSGSGVLDDGAPVNLVEVAARDGSLLSYRLITINKTYTVAFTTGTFEITGEYTDAQQFSISLASSGVPTIS